MTQNSDPVTVLGENESWEQLELASVGRLVTRIGGRMEIVPVNFVVDERSIVFRTAPGSKLAELVLNDEVLFEVDDFDERKGWSVIVRGRARALKTADEIAAVEHLPLRPLVPTVKKVFVRIEAEAISGRAFRFGPEPVGRYAR